MEVEDATKKSRGVRLRQARQRANLSQEAVGTVLNRSRSMVGAIERGESDCTADQLLTLCRLYKCSADSILLGGDDVPEDQVSVLQQLETIEPPLRHRLWMLYQLFIRPGVEGRAKARS